MQNSNFYQIILILFLIPQTIRYNKPLIITIFRPVKDI